MLWMFILILWVKTFCASLKNILIVLCWLRWGRRKPFITLWICSVLMLPRNVSWQKVGVPFLQQNRFYYMTFPWIPLTPLLFCWGASAPWNWWDTCKKYLNEVILFYFQVQGELHRATHDSNSQVEAIFQILNTREMPPTYFRTNKFTSSYQEIVDAYGWVVSRLMKLQVEDVWNPTAT